MTEQASNGENQNPQFSLQRIYVRDLSFEAPKSPEIFRYDAAHAFANERSEAYDVKSANAAWERMLEFLKKHL